MTGQYYQSYPPPNAPREPKGNKVNKFLKYALGCLSVMAVLLLVVIGGLGYLYFQTQNEAAIIEQTQEAARQAQVIAQQQTAEAVPLPTDTLLPPTALPATPTPVIQLTSPPLPTVIPTEIPPTQEPEPQVVDILNLPVPDEIEKRPVPAQAKQSLQTLYDTNFIVHDYYEATIRLSPFDIGPRVVEKPPYEVGATQTFFSEEQKIDAQLVAASDKLYFWFENSLDVSPEEAQEILNRFEWEYLPKLNYLYGDVWTPGVDNDPRFSILHVAGLDTGDELGFFSSANQYPATIDRTSNEQEIIFLNMEFLELGDDFYFGTLIHETHHLIHWNLDVNETAWLNEGLAQLAELYMGFQTASAYDYLLNTDIQLNKWDNEEFVFEHYASSYLFSTYLWEQFGDEAIQQIVRMPENGMQAVEKIVAQYRPDESLDQFFADWAVANFLDNGLLSSRYNYQNLDLSKPNFINRLSQPPSSLTSDIPQFGVHYIELDFTGLATLSFAGDTVVPLIDSAPPIGENMWVAAPVDLADSTLTRTFDLTDAEEATLEFWAWYDLEIDWDFAYIEASTDGGQTWRFLTPTHSTPGEFGPALNGRSADEPDSVNGWVKESINLDPYLGTVVTLRIELLTDASVSEGGLAIDDIAVPELGYFDDVEDGNQGWTASGFAIVGATLPQSWTVQLIDNSLLPTVTELPLNDANQGQWRVSLGSRGGVLVVTAQTPFVDSPATYWVSAEGN